MKNSVKESDETDNFIYIPIRYSANLDLEPSEIKDLKIEIHSGELFSFYATIKNNGLKIKKNYIG